MVAFVKSGNVVGHHTKEIWLEEKLQEDIFFGYNTDVRPLDMGNIIQPNLTFVIKNFDLRKGDIRSFISLQGHQKYVTFAAVTYLPTR